MSESEASATVVLTMEPKELSPDGIDITPSQDGGVLKTIKTAGTGEAGPGNGDKVFVHYVGTLADGSKFDSSRDRGQKFDFSLGQGSVIKAWDLGVATMKKGEVSLLTCRGDYAYGSRGSPPKIPANATLLFEVELFEWKGEDISPDSDGTMSRSIVTKGDGEDTPNDGSNVKVHIIGRHNNAVFEDRDVEFALGEGISHDVVDGVEHALTKFHKNEKSVITMNSVHAYGSAGCPSKNIPANAEVEYVLTLKEFESVKESWDMDTEEKLEQAEIAKTKGNNYFKQGHYKQAIKFYQKIADFLSTETSLEGEPASKREVVLLASYLNQAQCCLKMENYNGVCENCDKALEVKETSEKAFFRRGQAKLLMKEPEEAILDFQKVLQLDANNKAAKNQITIAQHQIKVEKEKSKKLYGGMFEKFAAIDAKREKDNPVPETEEPSEVTNGDTSETNGNPESETMETEASA